MIHSTESHSYPCGCRTPGECNHNLSAEADALDACIDEFTGAIKRKLHAKRYQGKTGWDDPAWTREEIVRQLREHIDKGDMIDVAAFAMFAWNRDG